MTSIGDKIIRWDQSLSVDEKFTFNDLHSFIIFRDNFSYSEYIPTKKNGESFSARLTKWLNNLSEDEWQKELFSLIPRIIFIGEKEFDSLYRAAFREKVQRWLIDLYNINVLLSNAQSEITTAINRTWLCTATDSMNIAAFCHINNITGNDFRPDWRSLEKFGDCEKIVNYMRSKNYENIVILEDFVGSGSQFLGKLQNSKKTRLLELIQLLNNKPKILFVPLILCPEGNQNINEAINQYGMSDQIQLSPVMLLPTDLFITPENKNVSVRIHELITQTCNVAGFKENPYGYNQTGSVIVMFTNTPNNTLTLLHNQTETWHPLFPRSSRW